jgi:alkaline phosphatase D
MLNRRALLRGGIAIPAAMVSWGRSLTAKSLLPGAIDDDCGVASGDPQSDSIVLWTRIPNAARQGLGHSATLSVRYQVAKDPGFASNSVVLTGEVPTGAYRDYTVKVRAEGLEPYTTYYYRFLVGSDYVSVIGRTKTAPAPGDRTKNIKFAYVSCQKFTDGYYPAYAHLAQEDVDFCVHLGDHIYEQEVGRHGQGDPLDGRVMETLDDFRAKWRYYLSDPHWREVRRLFPWIDLWDDHEIFNDYAGSRDRYHKAARVAAGYQAFEEYIPTISNLILSPDGIPSMKVYRTYRFGDLIELFVTDQRQYRTPIPCNGKYAAHQCPEARSPAHTMLGREQKAWFKDVLGASRATWKIHASQVMLSPMRLISYVKGVAEQTSQRVAQAFMGGKMVEDRGVYLTLDQWDGYPAEREELFSFLHQSHIDNYTVITGDIHSAFQSELRLDPVRNAGPVVGCELVTTSISSETNGRSLGPLAGFATWLVRRSNPDLKWSDLVNNGYAVLDVSQDGIGIRHMAVNSVWNPKSQAFIAREAKIAASRPGFA